jgi:NSS family neurotransmitter:Na+ symporter
MAFILATAASAVGLGNIWRFPTVVSQNGGGTFLIAYIIVVIVFGTMMLMTEIAIGRKTRSSPVGAYASLDRRGKFIGYLSVIVPAIIAPYYCVICGWILAYLAGYGSGVDMSEPGMFGDFVSSPLAILALFVIVALVAVTLYKGVSKGIEKLSVIFMPLFLVMLLVLVVYMLTQPGISDGLDYYLSFNLADLDFGVFSAALGQAFFSLSLAMGIVITYGSYMYKKEDIERCSISVGIIDTIVAILASLLIVPVVFQTYAGDIPSGPTLVFDALPNIFSGMPGGEYVAIAFFAMLFIAAFTSAVSIGEAVTSTIMDMRKVSRHKAVILFLIPTVIIGIIVALGFGVLDFIQIAGNGIMDILDLVSNSLLMPIVALCMCIFVGHVIGTKVIEDEIASSSQFRLRKVYPVMIKWVAPILILIILLGSFIDI